MIPRKLALPILVSGLVACGGSGGAQKATNAPGDKGAQGESIGEAAAAQGGLSALGGGTLATGAEAAMDGPLRADLVEKDAPVKLDGVLKEWPARTKATTIVKGSPGAVAFGVALQYDDAKLYIGGEVSDRSFSRTPQFAESEDHATFTVAFPQGGHLEAYELGLFAGKPGETAGVVRFTQGPRKGQDVPGAKIVEAPIKGGYSFEVAIPWTTFAEARTLRLGLRGAVRYHDAGTSSILATGPGETASPASLPPLPTEPEQAVVDGLLTPRGIKSQVPKVDLFVDLVGDAMKERVSVFDKYFTICGPGYRGGKQFFYRDLGAELLKIEARDTTGRGKDDLLLRRRFSVPGGSREWFEVWSLLGGDEPVTTFGHEIAIVSGAKHVDNVVHVGPKEIEVSVEPAVGWDAATYREGPSTDVEPILLPWGAVRSQTFKFEGSRFVKSSEVAQAPAPAAPGSPGKIAAVGPEVRRDLPTPSVKQNTDLSKQLLEQYRRDQNVAADLRPRFDLEVHVAEDPRPERTVLIGRDIVVFGPGFKGGSQYAFITLQQFADPADITDLTARDVNGDGAAELVVRGARHVTAQGQTERVDIELMFIYEVKSGSIARIFSIETAREQGQKRVQGLVQFVPARGGKGFDIDARPGLAKVWTDKTYPWQQDQAGAGTTEPLLLPWGGIPNLHYTWDGTKFTR